MLGLGRQKGAARILKSIEHLRDRVAHSQTDLTGEGGWPELAETADRIEEILHASELALDGRIAASVLKPPQLDAAV
jgi:hypothetical protein